MTDPAPDTNDIARRLLAAARARGLMIATAESCTGGLVSGALTAIPGASDAFDRGFVTYSYPAKTDLLGVPPEMLAAHGAVSEPVARAMAAGALRASRAGLAVAVTGVAGPGGSEAKPEGLVWFATATAAGPGNAPILHAEHRAFGPIGRELVRARSVETGLALALRALSGN